MGCQFDYRNYKTDSIDEAKKLWARDVEQACYDDGHSYSGTISMLTTEIIWRPETYGSLREAVVAVDQHSEKWEPPVGAKYKDANGEGFVIGGRCPS